MTPVAYDAKKEIRIAVVMYGGVSLAIYINGIAQELLQLVRATAIDAAGRLRQDDHELTSTAAVYRRLARAVDARFIIDVISGTSAGGINGIFLGKALANGQSLDQLKQLWIDEGDIHALINDKQSIVAPLTMSSPQKSLLNSQRMYLKLFEAFVGMDASGSGEPYVKELDVFATTTDIDGLTLPIRLADGIVFERRHRNVFHFEFADKEARDNSPGVNDFVEENNPFLAYVARCTSAFPFAFEPMCLKDIDAVVTPRPTEQQHASWRRFYEMYAAHEEPSPLDKAPLRFSERAFGDGGYLDNKPFSYATETLLRRHAETPVVRKLFYVEPTPEHPEDDPVRGRKPDAIENSLSALITIPGYETIREDLCRILDHNVSMQRIQRILAGIERDVDAALVRPGRLESREYRRLHTGEWATLDLAEMFEWRGRSYTAYNRLKVSAVTDDLVEMFRRVFGFDKDSSAFQNMRCLMRAWRDRQYVQIRTQAGQQTQNQFLLDFDLSYRLRRVRFVLNKIDELHRSEAVTREALRLRGQPQTFLEQVEGREMFRLALADAKRELIAAYRRLHALERKLYYARVADSPLFMLFGASEEDSAARKLRLAAFVVGDANDAYQDRESGRQPPGSRPVSDEECTASAKAFLAAGDGAGNRDMDALAAGLKALLAEAFARSELEDRTGSAREAAAAPAQIAARTLVHHYFNQYEDYDLVLFPILFQSDVLAEGAAIEVMRISPEDATCLMDDRAESRNPSGKRKLAGIMFGHFGGFLEREWRKNDIMWGRLDAAERLITSMLPEPEHDPLRRTLIDEAQRGIIREELSDVHRRELFDRLSAQPGVTAAMLTYAKSILLDEKEALEEYRLALDREPNPKATVRALARSTQVVGNMLEGIARQRQVDSKGLAIIAKLGRAFWGLVEVAVPRSIPQLLFKYWLQLVYAFAAVMIVAGLATPSPEVQRVGWTMFGLAAALNVAQLALSDYMQHRINAIQALLVAAAFALVALIAIGLWELPVFVAGITASIHSSRSSLLVLRTGTEWAVTGLGGIGVLLLVAGAWMQAHARELDFVQRRRKTSAGISAPILAIEVPETSEDVRTVVGEIHNPDRQTMAEVQRVDHVFLVLYWVFFVGIAVLIQRARVFEAIVPPFVLPGVVAIAATIGAIFDKKENDRILITLSAPIPAHPGRGDSLQAHVDATRVASLVKWAALYVALSCASTLFFSLNGGLVIPGIVLVVASAVGLIGLIKRPFLQLGSLLMGLGLLIVTIWLVVKPEQFLPYVR